jgi:preprotein translocase subunit SecA
LQTAILNQFGAKIEGHQIAGQSREAIEQYVNDLLLARYDEKERMIGPENLRQAERIIMLNVVDNQWKDHLLSMDELKTGIGLRGYGQKDPLIEYKKESFTMFQDMMDRIEDETIKYLYFMRIEMGHTPLPYPELAEEEDDPEAELEAGPSAAEIEAKQREAQERVQDMTRNIQRKKDRELADLQLNNGNGAGGVQPAKSVAKVGRNDMCPCGSGKKYKKCHGAAA